MLSTEVKAPESSLLLMTSGEEISRVTDDYVLGLLENRKRKSLNAGDDNASIGSNDTAKLSYT